MNEIPKCPKCNGDGYEYELSSTGRILYRCKKCYWRYNSISGTQLRGSRLSDEQIGQLHHLLYDHGWQIAQISRELKIHRTTVYRYKRLWNAERKASPNEA